MNSSDIAFLDAPEISACLFYPLRCKSVNGLEMTKTVVPGASVGGLWYERPSGDNVLLFFHGNGEVAADWSGVVDRFAASLDASVWLVDYRGYGTSEGNSSYGTMLSDAECLFNSLADRETSHGSPFRQRFVFGRSLGSAPAIHLAWKYRDRVDALVVDSGFAKVMELVRRCRELCGLPDTVLSVPPGFSDNVDKLSSCAMPTLFLHGAADTLIPPDAARRNFAASAASAKRLVEIPGAGHNDLILRASLDDSYFSALHSLYRMALRPLYHMVE